MSTNIVIKFIITDSKKFLLCSSLLIKTQKRRFDICFQYVKTSFFHLLFHIFFQILLLFVTDLIKVCFPFLSSIPMTVRSPSSFLLMYHLYRNDTHSMRAVSSVASFPDNFFAFSIILDTLIAVSLNFIFLSVTTIWASAILAATLL